MNKNRLAIVVALGCWAYSGVSIAAEAADDLIALLKKMDSYQAHFTQSIKSSTGEKISNTKGEVVIRRPDRFYWKSQKPDPIIVVADGKNLWTYDIDLQQATKQAQKTALKNSPAMLLAGATDKFQEDFTISNAKPGSCKSSKDRCFSLKPKQKDSTFKNIYIGFTQDKLVEVRMSDPLGQNVYTVFTDVKVNGAINDKLFKFMPPKGVDVIHYD